MFSSSTVCAESSMQAALGDIVERAKEAVADVMSSNKSKDVKPEYRKAIALNPLTSDSVMGQSSLLLEDNYSREKAYMYLKNFNNVLVICQAMKF
jgi:hypothetical protein